VEQVVARLTGVVLALLLLGGCGTRSPVPDPGTGTSPSPYRTYQVNQPWEEPSGWRLAVTGIRCGATDQLAPGKTDVEHVCLVGLGFTNEGKVSRPFTGTAENEGPTWRVSAYDDQGHEFHGHATQPVDPTAPGASGGTELVFEVPASVRLRRVLIGTGMVTLPAGR
jgi:hypothetical protein